MGSKGVALKNSFSVFKKISQEYLEVHPTTTPPITNPTLKDPPLTKEGLHKKQNLDPLEPSSNNIVEPMDFEVDIKGDDWDMVGEVLEWINLQGVMEECK